MQDSYTQNKRPKDMTLCQMIRRTINKSRKDLGFTWEDAAHELGMSGGTLDNKLKPAKHENDLTVSEFIHVLETTGDLAALEYINKIFDLVAVPKTVGVKSAKNITHLVDMAMIENNDVFSEAKKDLEDGVIDADEKTRILKELDEADTANANLRYMIKNLKV